MNSKQGLSSKCVISEISDEEIDFEFIPLGIDDTLLDHRHEELTPEDVEMILSVDSECNNKMTEERLLEDLIIEEIHSVRKTISTISGHIGVSFHEGETILKNSLLCGSGVIKRIHKNVIEKMIDELETIGTIAVISKEKYDNEKSRWLKFRTKVNGGSMILKPTVENYLWIKSIIDEELKNGEKLNEYIMYKWLEYYFNIFFSELSVEQSLELLNKAMPFLSDIHKDYLLEVIFELDRKRCNEETAVDERKIKLIIKQDLFDKVGVYVEKCSVYEDEKMDKVKIYGILVCNEWDNELKMEIVANVYDYNNEIAGIICDNDYKYFFKTGYETFYIEYSIDRSLKVNSFEIYPRIKNK